MLIIAASHNFWILNWLDSGYSSELVRAFSGLSHQLWTNDSFLWKGSGKSQQPTVYINHLKLYGAYKKYIWKIVMEWITLIFLTRLDYLYIYVNKIFITEASMKTLILVLSSWTPFKKNKPKQLVVLVMYKFLIGKKPSSSTVNLSILEC